MILARTGDELSRGQACGYCTNRRTDAGNDNTWRPKLASGKNRNTVLPCFPGKIQHDQCCPDLFFSPPHPISQAVTHHSSACHEAPPAHLWVEWNHQCRRSSGSQYLPPQHLSINIQSITDYNKKLGMSNAPWTTILKVQNLFFFCLSTLISVKDQEPVNLMGLKLYTNPWIETS